MRNSKFIQPILSSLALCLSAVALALAGVSLSAFADDNSDLLSALATPEKEWVFNHVCLPADFPEVAGHTNGDYLQALAQWQKLRWEQSLREKHNGHEEQSLVLFTPVEHSIMDLHLANHISRNARGEITKIASCAELGGKNVLLNEAKYDYDSSELQAQTRRILKSVNQKWRNSASFEEAAKVLQSDNTLTINANYSAMPIRR